MASTLGSQFLVGTAFGASLLLSGVSNPITITSQFKLEDFHMLVTFLAASSVSAVVVYVSNRSGYAALAPRSCSDYGWMGRYGGNVVGGVMQGVGMVLTGACPGTVLVQSAMGGGRGVATMVGCVVGGGLFLLFGESLRDKKVVAKRKKVVEVKTFQEKLNVSTEQMIVMYEAVMVGVITLASWFGPMGTPWRNALLGGGMIGLAQASSVLLSKKTLGVSTAYQDVAGHLIGLIDHSKARPGWSSIVFAAGVMSGAKLVSRYASYPGPGFGAAGISNNAALVGGALSIFGARLAGGCTSGHGISGCSTLSVSSMITVASIFGGGIAYKGLVG